MNEERKTMTVEQLIDTLKNFKQDLPIEMGADGTTWEINDSKSIFTQDIDGRETVVMWEGFW